jgi:hypothetical protein
MKRTLTIIAFLMLSVLAFAQRTDYCSVKADNKDYQVFSYVDESGAPGYYLSLGAQTCIYIGSNAAEAQRTLNSLVNLVDSPEGTVQEFQARTFAGGKPAAFGTTNSVVEKKSGPKHICFPYNQTESYLTKKAATAVSAAAKGTLK